MNKMQKKKNLHTKESYEYYEPFSNIIISDLSILLNQNYKFPPLFQT